MRTYSTATCSGSVARSGNVPSMSVKTFDSGCESWLRSGRRSDIILGYSGPIRSLTETPFSACCRRSARKSSSKPSRGQVGLMFLTGTEKAGVGLAKAPVEF